ncbi:MAG: hypothetical protein S0880_08530 [Actinomycetota bacterium]|nr:hypothetical protein [Actinomycetota bacterium]
MTSTPARVAAAIGRRLRPPGARDRWIDALTALGADAPDDVTDIDQARSLATAAVLGSGHDWVLPRWLTRARSGVAGVGVAGGVVNRTGRDATPIGLLDSGHRALVDPAGLVVTEGRGSIDWWVGGDDRWYVPAREASVRQRLVDDTPVVETSLRVPGGDVVHRAAAARDLDGCEVVVIEVENQSSVPVALALAVRPFDLDGFVPLQEVELDGERVLVDGHLGLLLSAPPRLVALGDAASGDAFAAVDGGAATEPPVAARRCAAGVAQITVVVPVSHGATVRAVVPLEPDEAPPNDVSRSPDPARVARGWGHQVGATGRIVLPEGRLTTGTDITWARTAIASMDGPPGGRDLVIGALARTGRLDVAAERFVTAVSSPSEERSANRPWSGRGARRVRIAHEHDDPDHDIDVLLAAADLWRLTRDIVLARSVVAVVAASAERLANSDRTDLAAAVALSGAAELLDAADEPRAAAQAASVGRERRRIAASGLARRSAEGTLAPAAAHELLRALVADPLTTRQVAADALRRAAAPVIEPLLAEGLFARRRVPPAGIDVAASLALAALDLRIGEPERAVERLEAVAGLAGPTVTWASVVDDSGGGIDGSPADDLVVARWVAAVRDLLVLETGPTSLALCSALPVTWRGQGIEVHDLPTAVGACSYAVRWHAERPAILWEIEPHEHLGAPLLVTAPGLDPTWSSTEPKGEALLGPVGQPANSGSSSGGPTSFG